MIIFDLKIIGEIVSDDRNYPNDHAADDRNGQMMIVTVVW